MTRSYFRRGVLATMVASALLGALGVSSAFATPKGEFAVFSDCPLSNGSVETCVVSKATGGEFTIGKQNVPIVNTQTLQGGFFEEESGELAFVGAADGNTLSKTPQKVPGGLSGLVNCTLISNFFERIACELVFENGATGVNAITELAGPASSIKLNELAELTATGTALSLPVKVRLENAFLGSECYIGSNSHPIVLNLTSGTTSPPAPNKPITGAPGTLSSNPTGEILKITGDKLVDNSFAAPGTSGCGGLFSFLIDPIINAKIGLPSAAGHNTAILAGNIEQASKAAVIRSE